MTTAQAEGRVVLAAIEVSGGTLLTLVPESDIGTRYDVCPPSTPVRDIVQADEES